MKPFSKASLQLDAFEASVPHTILRPPARLSQVTHHARTSFIQVVGFQRHTMAFLEPQTAPLRHFDNDLNMSKFFRELRR